MTWRIECCSRASFIKPGGRFQYVYRRFSGCLPDLNHQNAKTEFFRTGKLFKIYKGTFEAKSFLVYSLFVPWRGICRYQFTYVSPPKVRFTKKMLILSSDAVLSRPADAGHQPRYLYVSCGTDSTLQGCSKHAFGLNWFRLATRITTSILFWGSPLLCAGVLCRS